jgi:hypothetical protein
MYKLFQPLTKPVVLALASTIVAVPAVNAQDDSELAKAAQNPLAKMISIPIQNNINFDAGPLEKTQNVLNIQPVYPVDLNDNWNVITRTIIPIISQPSYNPSQDRKDGLGDIQFSAFLSPKATSGDWVWGAGFIAQLDTASDDRLGQGATGIGPSAVALNIGKTWVYGALINNVWSVSEDDGRQEVNQMLAQPFVNYNFADHPGRYLTFSPVITANWEANSGNKWTVPLGMGVGQIVRFGKLPVNLQASAYYNIERPDYAAKSQVRLQAQLMFPK